MKNYYQILDLEPTIKITVISDRFRDLAHHFIIDRYKENSADIGFELQAEAFYVLKNVKRKAIYDTLHARLFENEPIKRVSKIKEWERTIAKAATEGKEYARKLIALPISALQKRIKKDTKIASDYGWWLEIPLFFFDFLSIFS